MYHSFFSSLFYCVIRLLGDTINGTSVFYLIPSALKLLEFILCPNLSYLNISTSMWEELYLVFVIHKFLKEFMDTKDQCQTK